MFEGMYMWLEDVEDQLVEFSLSKRGFLAGAKIEDVGLRDTD
tara:strand:- start:395 stop:520 length:126 start_codon:yes stop_codon:yes gene_type:complete